MKFSKEVLIEDVDEAINKNKKILQLDGKIERLDSKIDNVDMSLRSQIKDLDLKIDSVRSQLKKQIDRNGVMIEGLQHKLDTVLEGFESNTSKTDKIEEIEASIDDHEARLDVLEISFKKHLTTDDTSHGG